MHNSLERGVESRGLVFGPSDAGSLAAQQLLALWASQVTRKVVALKLEHKGKNTCARSQGTCPRTLCTPGPSLAWGRCSDMSVELYGNELGPRAALGEVRQA